MRARLMVILTIPVLLLFLFLGAAYAVSEVKSNQQEMFFDRLSDAGNLVITARQSLIADDPDIAYAELVRYRDVYGIEAAVLNQSGEAWASNGLDPDTVEARFDALAGRTSNPSEAFAPWMIGDLEVATPVFDGSDLVGAVITSSDTEELVRDAWLLWGTLVLVGFVAFVVAIAIASRLATWVLRPVRAVDGAMAEIGRGELGARIPESTGPPELQQVVAQFNQMAGQVEQLMQKQQEFVSNASHELRNPLNALLLRIEDLAFALPESEAAEIEHVRSEGSRMARILDALLVLARAEAVNDEPDPVEVGALMESRIDSWRLIARERDITFEVSHLDPAWALVDPIVLETAFDAVVDNAVKFSPKGGVISVALTDEDGMIEVAVRDRGPGLSPAEIAKVTDRFWRSTEHSDVRGSGLGLAIAAELLDSSGGDLRVTLPDDRGMCVELRILRAEEVEQSQ